MVPLEAVFFLLYLGKRENYRIRRDNMADIGIYAALQQRYDGPLPLDAAFPPDWDRPRHEQIANRKRWAWSEVRRLGRRMVAARRAFRATGALAHHRDWARARGSLEHALATWACFRGWLARLERIREA
jgi:hypothetical protein